MDEVEGRSRRRKWQWKIDKLGRKRLALFATFSLMISLSGCESRDYFPMHNPLTGQDVVCRSGPYFIEESSAAADIFGACISACEVHGFRQTKYNQDADEPPAVHPPERLKSEIPKVCLP